MRPLVVAESDPEAALEILDRVDGLMLLGGGDLDPARYGAEPHPEVYGVDPDRDAVEIALVRAAADRGIPTLAICRGIQVVNVAFGETLVQHLPDVPGLVQHGVPGGGTPARHTVKVTPDTRLAEAVGRESVECSSHHHQALDRLGDGLVVTSRADDGVIEAVELDGPGWMVAVQWHPEDTAAEDAAQQALFDALAERARAQSRSK
jgi:putative glutamine amidotransferase